MTAAAMVLMVGGLREGHGCGGDDGVIEIVVGIDGFAVLAISRQVCDCGFATPFEEGEEAAIASRLCWRQALQAIF